MGKYIFDHSNGLWYELHGDYFIPCLALEEVTTPPLGIWGRKRLRYLKEHRPVLYSDLMLSGKLHSNLAEIDDHASKMLDQLMEQMAKQQGITEQLKAQDQMAWVQHMNNIRNAAEEIILHELIYGNEKKSQTTMTDKHE